VEKLGYTLPDELTWDFIWEVSDAAAKQDENGNYLVNGQKVMIPFIYKSTDNMMIQMLKQKNAAYSDLNGNIGIFNTVTKDLLSEIAEHAQKGAFSTFKISSYPANYLNAGQCVFAIDSTAGSTWMGSDAPLSDISEDKIVEFETEVMAVPQFDTSNPQMISQGPSICLFNKGDSQQVLASWLFMQYLLTNDVQIGYSQTEGYVPVTLKARQSDEYMEYLSDIGSDNDTHYEVKIKATKLLIDNTENTFVTPVFNGSASLRDAAGQLIENTVKAVRRKQTVDDKFFEELFSDVSALYRLDQINAGGQSTGKEELGPLPSTSVILLSALVTAWVLMLMYVIWERVIKKRRA
jgi:multiple sugar transport system substrate-binding protein